VSYAAFDTHAGPAATAATTAIGSMVSPADRGYTRQLRGPQHRLLPILLPRADYPELSCFFIPLPSGAQAPLDVNAMNHIDNIRFSLRLVYYFWLYMLSFPKYLR